MISKIVLENFTAFEQADIEFDAGINVIVGENSTGKTHLMKAIYAACAVEDIREERTFDQKLKAVFMPDSIGRLVHRSLGRSKGKVVVYKKNGDGMGNEHSLSCEISTLNKTECTDKGWKTSSPQESIFIPVKDMLANAPGFRALVSQRKVYFEEIYQDIIDKAFLPVSRGRLSEASNRLLDILRHAISGRVIEKNEMFYLKNKSGELEFPLLAEGYRKLGLLYKLIQNETLARGTMLFWDEPEANLNPKLSRVVVEIMLALQKMGVQIFLTTHDYVLLKEFELEATEEHSLLYHVLFHDENGKLRHRSTHRQDELDPNAIDSAYGDILDRQIEIGLKG